MSDVVPFEWAFWCVVIARLLVPFVVFRYPLLGVVLAIICDSIDTVVFNHFNQPGPLGWEGYHIYDKICDTWYLAILFLATRTWQSEMARSWAEVLFGWRFIGFLVFCFGFLVHNTEWYWVFFVTPNLFEVFFVVWCLVLRFNLQSQISWKGYAVLGVALFSYKALGEYFTYIEVGGSTFLQIVTFIRSMFLF